MKNGLSKNKTYLEFNDKDVSGTKSRNENSVTMKDSIFEFKFYTIYEMAFLMINIILTQILNPKLFKKIYGFMVNKDNKCTHEEYHEKKKINIPNYQQNAKHLIFYQTKNVLKSLTNKPNLILGNSDISTEKCTEYIESLFDSFINISFVYTSNYIKLIIIGQIDDEIFAEQKYVKKEKTKFKYTFNKILFILYFDCYSCIYNNGKTIANISLKIKFPDNIRYSSYFNLLFGKYVNKYMTKSYDGNEIMSDIITKFQKFIFVNQSHRKYKFYMFEGESKKITIRTKIIYNNDNENNLVEESEYDRQREQIQYNQSLYDENDEISDKFLLDIQNYTIID